MIVNHRAIAVEGVGYDPKTFASLGYIYTETASGEPQAYQVLVKTSISDKATVALSIEQDKLLAISVSSELKKATTIQEKVSVVARKLELDTQAIELKLIPLVRVRTQIEEVERT